MKIMKSTILSLLVLFVVGQVSIAQENIKIKKADFQIEIKEVGFTDAWKEIKEGEKLFNAGLGTYPSALEHYLKANKYNSDCAQLNYKIGVCYLATDKFYYATEYLEKAYLKDKYIILKSKKRTNKKGIYKTEIINKGYTLYVGTGISSKS